MKLKPGVILNAAFGIFAELLYAAAIMLSALAVCLAFSLIKP
ncbi:MAG: hypothetical protein PHS64_03940 [Candidatus Omnitrophica bacterium]|nr:hypothetical protein [Candidatus Omnitrophota bacterium]MDD5775076.1 hypothetical protein [Candidatus Omnitrophota bacterium]HNQ49979.1 hypothetical protein [Candidatus Omnitrophota bacterium]HQO37371.1 hypothetical protein [Candidatus Omnitrophota bacterium]HQQ06133.1 hypothetical protein [Candidatus Omnitrophota bacterium]